MTISAAGANGAVQTTQKVSDIIGSITPIFRPATPGTFVTSLDFDDSGDFLLAARSDESLQLYNIREGKHEKTLLSKKYGCHLARFTHHSQAIVYASTKGDDTIRYLSTHDNQFLRYFKGHTAPVTSLEVSPGSDTFVSSSLDNTVRLWNLNSPNPQGQLNLATPTLTAFDGSATVLAVACPAAACILLYDVRQHEKAPFQTFDLNKLESNPHIKAISPDGVPREWNKLEFSNDGKSILLGTTHSAGHILLDAFNGELKALLVRAPRHLPLNPAYQRPAPFPPAAPPVPNAGVLGQGDSCFTADGRYVVGSSGGEHDAVVWDVQGMMDDEEKKVMAPLAGLPWKGNISVLAWNPRYNLMASGDKEVLLWTPDPESGGMKPP